MLCATLFTLFTLHVTTVLCQSECSLEVSNPQRKDVYFNVFKWKPPIESPTYSNKALKNGDVVNLECNTGFLKKDFIAEKLAFGCENGKFNKSFAYEDLLCRSDFHKKDVITQVSPSELGSKLLKCDDKNLEVYKVKVEKPDGSLKHLYTVCLDKNLMRPKFSFQPKRTVKPTTEFVSRANDVWGFTGYGANAEDRYALSQGYVQKLQQRRFTRAFAGKYSQNRPYPYYFNRGHLAPYAHFADNEEQRATSQYMNAAPQWKDFNEGTWSLVEKDVKKFLLDKPNDWEIYTGTYGVIPTNKGPLFAAPTFFNDGRFKKGFLPVPMLFWKIAHNVQNATLSRVYVGINNPELQKTAQFNDAYKICEPLKGENGALYKGNEFQGFTYECALDEFLKKLATTEKIVK